MIYEAIMYGIKCSRCQEIYFDSEDRNLAAGKEDVEESASEDGWHIDGDNHYCPNCHTVNDNDEVVLKPTIDYNFFKFKNTLRMLAGREFIFSETETLLILTSNYCYKRLTEAQVLVLRDIIPDFVVDYRTPEKCNGKPYVIEVIRIPKDFNKK